MADVENHAPEPRRESRVARQGPGRALGRIIGAFVQDMMKRFDRKRGILRELANSHQVDHGRGLTGVSWVDHVKVGDVIAFDMVSEEVGDGVLTVDPAPSSLKG